MGVLRNTDAQHLGSEYELQWVVGTWGKLLMFMLVFALWGQFGYCGNFGIFFGFWNTCAVCPFILFLAMFDVQKPVILNITAWVGLPSGGSYDQVSGGSAKPIAQSSGGYGASDNSYQDVADD